MGVYSKLVSGLVAAVVCAAGAAAAAGSVADHGTRAKPAVYENCTSLNRKYAHGVGRTNAWDRVSGRTTPVASFKRSNKLYAEAMHWNRGLDRDRDGVACERA